MYEVTCAVIRRFINVNFIQFVGLASKLQPLEKDKKLGKLYAVFTKIIRKKKDKKTGIYMRTNFMCTFLHIL